MVIWLVLACTFITAQEREDRRDQDGDGYISVQWGGTDCDDADPLAHPDAPEICETEADEDCDGNGACVQWMVDGTSARGIGDVLASVDLDQDGTDDLILGMPDSNLVGAIWGPLESDGRSLDQSYEGLRSTGIALDASPSFRSGAPAVLVASRGEALLMQDTLGEPVLTVTGDQDGFGEQVQLLGGSAPWIAVGTTQAIGGERAVFLFDALEDGTVDSVAAIGTLKLEASDQGLRGMVGLDHNGDGQEELAVAIEREGSKPESVLLLEPGAGQTWADDVEIELSGGNDTINLLSSGDFDGDGRVDLAVASSEESGDRGKVRIFFGPIASTKLDDADLTISGGGSGDAFGSAMSAVSTPDEAELLLVASGQGPVWLLSVEEGVEVQDALWSDPNPASSVSAGDLDGDGWQDLLMGFPDALDGAGQVWIVSGKHLP